MCGICGVVGIDGTVPPGLQHALHAMTRALNHRGPDGEGYHSSVGALLGHRRLSIIDRAGGTQPMGNEDGTVWVVFNGEIYNHHFLREALIARGHVFRTSSDTETLVHGYEEYGERLLDKLQGMFAFAVYDEKRRELFLARDRVGKKPLFYGIFDGVLHFGSEIKALRESPLWDGEVDRDAVESYLALGYVLAPRTIYKRVKKLPPAHFLMMRDGKFSIHRYWDVVDFGSDDRAESEILAELDGRLAEAVRDRLESEVPLGAFLSGGIDSGLVVSYMAAAIPSVVTTSVGFGDRAHNELDAAELTAAHLGTRHYPEQVEPRLEAVLDSIAASFDEPFADSSAVPTQYVSALARRHVTVALSGDGGDEVFGGYGFRYIPHLVEDWARRIVRPTGVAPLIFAAGTNWPRGSRLPRWLRFGTYLQNIGSGAADAYYADICFLRPEVISTLLAASGAVDFRERESYAVVRDAYCRCPSRDPVQKAQYADLHVYLPNDPLVKVDRMSMLHSLEVRSPLLDHRLIEFAFRVPRQVKLRRLQAKHLLRVLATRKLPARVLALPKRGFTAPVGRWITESAELLRGTVLNRRAAVAEFVDIDVASGWLEDHVAGRADYSSPLWALWMFQKWHDTSHVPGFPSPDLAGARASVDSGASQR